jgi:hypothetical protein
MTWYLVKHRDKFTFTLQASISPVSNKRRWSLVFPRLADETYIKVTNRLDEIQTVNLHYNDKNSYHYIEMLHKSFVFISSTEWSCNMICNGAFGGL